MLRPLKSVIHPLVQNKMNLQTVNNLLDHTVTQNENQD